MGAPSYRNVNGKSAQEDISADSMEEKSSVCYEN